MVRPNVPCGITLEPLTKLAPLELRAKLVAADAACGAAAQTSTAAAETMAESLSFTTDSQGRNRPIAKEITVFSNWTCQFVCKVTLQFLCRANNAPAGFRRLGAPAGVRDAASRAWPDRSAGLATG